MYTLNYRILDQLLFSKIAHCKNKKLYEEFLLSVVNSSQYFLSKSEGERYKFPDSQSNGECDCNSRNYKLDFKLLISHSYMEGKSIHEFSYLYLQPGVRITQPAEKPLEKEKKVGLVYNQLSASYVCEEGFDKEDIRDIKKCLKKRKHILFFLPCEISLVDKNLAFDEDKIDKLLTEDFLERLVEFRKECLNDYDTYFAYIYNGHVVLSVLDVDGIQFVEKVGLNENKIYNMINNFRQSTNIGNG